MFFQTTFFCFAIASLSTSLSNASLQSCSSSSTVKSNKTSGSLFERIEKLEDECNEIVSGSKPEDVLSGTNSNGGGKERKGDKGDTETKEAAMHDMSANKKHNQGGDVIL
jgi:hypothetical protein